MKKMIMYHFLSCGIALNVGKVVIEPEKLFYNSPEKLAVKWNYN